MAFPCQLMLALQKFTYHRFYFSTGVANIDIENLEVGRKLREVNV